jgi:DMSO/TMAO reductase YedYZ molybdopterin-dependent catalytic subunit
MRTFSEDELRLALRNPEMPLEALTLDVTPTGMHYVLAHYDIPLLDTSSWRLRVSGLVGRPASLSLDDLRRFPTTRLAVTLECARNGRALMLPRHEGQPWHVGGVSTAVWTGVRLVDVLRSAGASAEATYVSFTGADEGIEDGVRQAYAWGLSLDDVAATDPLLAFEMNDRPLEPQHGAPVRLIVPGWYGMASVKWLVRVDLLDRPFDGPQLASYRSVQRQDDEGDAISRIRPRALMRPPGIVDDEPMRIVEGPRFTVVGRAWSGSAPIERVEISSDGGAIWADAQLDEQPDARAWVGWRAIAELPRRGVYELSVRATDATGDAQPLEPPWNLWGYVNNVVQRVAVRWP